MVINIFQKDQWILIILYSIVLIFGVITSIFVIFTLVVSLRKTVLSKPSALYVMHMGIVYLIYL